MFKNNLRSWYIYIYSMIVCMYECMYGLIDGRMDVCMCMYVTAMHISQESRKHKQHQCILSNHRNIPWILQQVFHWGRKKSKLAFCSKCVSHVLPWEFLHQRFWKTPPAGIVRDPLGISWDPTYLPKDTARSSKVWDINVPFHSAAWSLLARACRQNKFRPYALW